jgi:hypothetical protein
VDGRGVLHYVYVHDASGSISQLAAFQLCFNGGGGAGETSLLTRPLSQPWQTFHFVPGMPGELMLVQAGSKRVLYATLARQEYEPTEVYLFGTHNGAGTLLLATSPCLTHTTGCGA